MGCRTDDMFGLAADRLESQERELLRKTEELEEMQEAATVLHSANETHWTYIKELTARAEQAEAREKAIVRCSDCVQLNVINSDIVYAQCKKYGFAFFPFEADTRETGCTRGERGLPQEGEGERCRVEF